MAKLLSIGLEIDGGGSSLISIAALGGRGRGMRPQNPSFMNLLLLLPIKTGAQIKGLAKAHSGRSKKRRPGHGQLPPFQIGRLQFRSVRQPRDQHRYLGTERRCTAKHAFNQPITANVCCQLQPGLTNAAKQPMTAPTGIPATRCQCKDFVLKVSVRQCLA